MEADLVEDSDNTVSNDASSESEEEEQRDWEDTSPLVLYLLFYAVLLQDVKIARDILRSGVKPEWQLIFKILEEIDETVVHGIHSSVEARRRYSHYIKHKNSLSTKPNLLEMVCLSPEDKGRREMLNLLLQYRTDISTDTLSSVVFNPVASRDSWEVLITLSARSRTPQTRLQYLPCKKFAYTSLLIDIVSRRWQKCASIETKHFLFGVLEDVLQWYDIESENQLREWSYSLSYCIEKTTELKEPALLQLFLNKHRAVEEQVSGFGWSSFRYSEKFIQMLPSKFAKAVENKSYYSLYLLINAGEEYGNICGFYPDSPLLSAIKRNDVYAVVMLLETFEKLSWVCGFGSSAMSLAATCGNENDIIILWLLCARGGYVNACDPTTGETVLFRMVRRKCIIGVELLLKYDADVNYHGGDGATPLFMAVVNHDLEMIRLLLCANANTEVAYVDVRSFTRKTAASHALYQRHYDTLQILLAAGAKVPAKCRVLLDPLNEEEEEESVISIITADGRVIIGVLKGFDQTINLILEESHERVYSVNDGVEEVPLGLYIVRGDNVAVVGEVDEEMDRSLDLQNIKADPLNPVVH